MSFWITLWKACLIGTIIAFALMAVVVTIGGAKDIRTLFRRLNEPSEEEED